MGYPGQPLQPASYSTSGAEGSQGAQGRIKTICFDLDGTLCTNTYGAYDTAEPFWWAIERVNALARAGHRIVVFTARGTATGIDWEEVTRRQLELWGVSHDELKLGKPSADVYVDDRAVHTTAWRESGAFTAPGFFADPPAVGEELPAVLPAQRTAVAETGRTIGGKPFLLDVHVQRALGRASAAGIVGLPEPAQVHERVVAALAASNADEDEQVFTIQIADRAGAAFIDTWEPPERVLEVGCRTLRQVSEGLRALLGPDAESIALVAATVPADRPAWPLQELKGSLADALGGRLAVAEGRRVTVAPDSTPPSAMSGWLSELASAAGLELVEGHLATGELERADEVFVACVPFGLLALASVDGTALGRAGTARRALVNAWSARAGVDLDRQLALILRRTEGE